MRWLCIALLALALPAVASAAPALNGTFDPKGNAQRLALGPDGNVWFTISDSTATDSIGNPTPKQFGKITPTGDITEYETPGNVSPIGIVAGPDGKMWMTAPNSVIEFSPSNPDGATAHTISDIGTSPQTIVVGPDHNLWTAGGQNIIKIDTTGAELNHYVVTGLDPHGIAAGGDGNIWVVDHGGARILKAPTSSAQTDPTQKFDTVDGGQEITAGPPGQLAFTDPQGLYIGRIDYSGHIDKTPVPLGTDPTDIVFANDRAYWTPEFAADAIGRLTTTGTHTQLHVPAGSGPRRMTKGLDNTLWVGFEKSARIARITGVSAPPSLPVTPPAPGTVADTIAPGVTTYSLSSKVIRPFTSGASIAAKVTRGTRVTYTLTEAATATFTVQRLVSGRKVKVKRRTRCLKPTRKNAKHRKCTRAKRAGSFTRASTPGANSFTFTGRLNGKPLKPGRYRLRLVARDAAGNASKARSLRFRVVK